MWTNYCHGWQICGLNTVHQSGSLRRWLLYMHTISELICSTCACKLQITCWLWLVLCDTFDTSISIVSTNISIPVSKRSWYVVVLRYHPVSWQYQFRYCAVYNWIVLLLTTTAHCVTTTKKHVTLKLVKHIVNI